MWVSGNLMSEQFSDIGMQGDLSLTFSLENDWTNNQPSLQKTLINNCRSNDIQEAEHYHCTQFQCSVTRN